MPAGLAARLRAASFWRRAASRIVAAGNGLRVTRRIGCEQRQVFDHVVTAFKCSSKVLSHSSRWLAIARGRG
jgi:hypothetical protein